MVAQRDFLLIASRWLKGSDRSFLACCPSTISYRELVQASVYVQAIDRCLLSEHVLFDWVA
ncbi:hypothetical protein CJO88_05640 [Ralstonia solanacearum]|nr:hypothetical protein CJO88_05640 [Ralstonia solanacearum]